MEMCSSTVRLVDAIWNSPAIKCGDTPVNIHDYIPPTLGLNYAKVILNTYRNLVKALSDVRENDIPVTIHDMLGTLSSVPKRDACISFVPKREAVIVSDSITIRDIMFAVFKEVMFYRNMHNKQEVRVHVYRKMGVVQGWCSWYNPKRIYHILRGHAEEELDSESMIEALIHSDCISIEQALWLINKKYRI